MKRLIFGLVLLGIGGLLSWYFLLESVQLRVERYEGIAISKEISDYNDLADKINSTDDLEVLYQVEKDLKEFPADKQEEVNDILQLRIAILSFQKAEDALKRARNLQAAIDPIPPLPPPPPPDEYYWDQPEPKPINLHPLVQKLVDQVIFLYNDAKKRIDQLDNKEGDVEFNFTLNYTKGEIYYRHAQLLSTDETVKELFDQTVTYYKRALREKVGDLKTVINIEILLKNMNSILANASRPLGQKRRILTPNTGLGTSTGI